MRPELATPRERWFDAPRKKGLVRMNRYLLIALAAVSLWSAGCRSRRVVRGVAAGGETGGGGRTVQVGSGEVAHGTPREQLDQLDRVLRAQGYQPVGPVTHGNLGPNGISAYQIDVRRGHCYSLALIGDSSSDPNLVILDPAGRDIGHDVRNDAHPWVSFCAARGGRFVARVQMAHGQGEYFFAPYFMPGRTPVDLSAFFGGTTGPQLASIDDEMRTRLQQLDARLGAEQFQRVGEPNGLMLETHQERTFQLSLERGRCYAFAALGGTGTTDTDVFLLDGSGHRLAVDDGAARDSSVRYCAPETGNYSLSVQAAEGAGAVFTVGYVQSVGSAPAPEVPVIASTSQAAGGLDENFALLDADMRARGYESLGDEQRNQLAAGAEQTYSVDLEGGRCYAILAVGDSAVRTMSLSLTDASGGEVDRDDGDDARPTVRVCPQSTGRYVMHVRMVSGSGGYVYAPYRWPRGTRLGDLAGVLYVRLAEITALLRVEGFSPDPGYSMERGRMRREGQSATHSLQLQGGQCYSVVVVGGEGVRDLDVSLLQGSQEMATDYGLRNAFPTVRYCPQGPGTFTVNVRAASGAGDYVYQVFSQSAAIQ
jgi:hypothetical protein